MEMMNSYSMHYCKKLAVGDMCVDAVHDMATKLIIMHKHPKNRNDF